MLPAPEPEPVMKGIYALRRDDPELDAMAIIKVALAELTESERRRVIQWVASLNEDK